ncbi:sulfite exporter TauE/SafE family protein [Teredinibacter purpureus]|uniref:sulfite exporter TauE/SafE family protein n=1 Tax=Teredinibacter purpureus TaxID=2731756 RepID=UPI00069693E8|nr:sulfite exporter TauE/SafE family protein [Teredinibacter purpureus]
MSFSIFKEVVAGGNRRAYWVQGALIIVVWFLWMHSLGVERALSIVQEYWQVSLTMVFGSFIAGATSEGGGAIAFPVFTKILNVSPSDAKLFSLAIQSVGMTAASILIVLLGTKVQWNIIVRVSVGGAVGIAFGLFYVAHIFSPVVIKILFTVLVTSFAVTLYILNSKPYGRHSTVNFIDRKSLLSLYFVGFLGGIVSGLVGNGIDIISFSFIVLYLKLDEKIATPTSVILMAINALIGVVFIHLFGDGVGETVYNYWLSAVPIVVIGAPLGAYLCSRLDRDRIVMFLLALIAIEFVTTVLIIPFTVNLVIIGFIALALNISIFYALFSDKKYLVGKHSIIS